VCILNFKGLLYPSKHPTFVQVMADLPTPRLAYRTLAATDDRPCKHDAAFMEDDANIILTSSDGVDYRVHAFTLRTTSGFFRDMISLPQHDSAESREDSITLDEPSKVLGTLLRMICGFGITKWASYDEAENVLAAAQKYDMTGPLVTIRSAMTSPFFLEEPLRLYAVAARYGWEEEAKLASKYTLTLSLHDDEHAAILKRIPTDYVLRLFRLHRARRDQFKKHITRDNGCFGIQNCTNCHMSVQHSTLGHLTNSIIWEMDRRPAGDELLEGQWKEWPVYKGDVCTRHCSATFINTGYEQRISREIKSCLRSLPSTI